MLLSYDKATQRISLRHYSITAAPSGVSKGVKSLVNQRAVPDLSNVQVGLLSLLVPYVSWRAELNPLQGKLRKLTGGCSAMPDPSKGLEDWLRCPCGKVAYSALKSEHGRHSVRVEKQAGYLAAVHCRAKQRATMSLSLHTSETAQRLLLVHRT